MSPISIEPYRTAQHEALLQLLQSADLPVSDLTPERLQNFLLACDSRVLRGTAGVEHFGEIGLLRSVVVRSEVRGTGLGKRLVQAIEMRAGRLGIKQLYLLTTTAEPFFAAQGYRQLARKAAPAAIRGTVEFSQLCPDSSIFMIKTLD